MIDFPTPTARRWMLVVSLFASLVMFAASPTVRAADEATLTVAAGVGAGWHDPGDHVVVTATVTSDGLLNGRLEVVATSGAVVSRDVQVAGGTTKTVMLVAPTGYDVAPIVVNLYRGNELIASESVTMAVAEGVELVGVLPALATRAGELTEQVALATGVGTAMIRELSVEQMSLGAAALEAFDTIAATTADLRSLQHDQLSALLAWLNRGGRLLLDDDGDLAALPEAWRPGSAGYALAGRGEIRVVDGRASNNEWSTLVEPSGSASSEASWWWGSNEQLGYTAQDLALRAGVRQPSLMPLLIPLLAYTCVVSVGLYFVLRAARRLTLAWIAIPVLASVTAVGVFAYGQTWRSIGRPAAATFVESFPGGADAMSSVLTFSRDGGTSTIHMPAGWQSDSELTQYFGGYSGVPTRLASTPAGSEVQVRLEPGQVTSVNVVGPATEAGLVVTATVREGNVIGTVANLGTVTLHQVAVFAPGGVDDIGTLAPGADAEFTIKARPLAQGLTRADRVWKGTSHPNATEAEIAELGIWANAGFARSLYPSALVRAAGWTTELTNGFEISGGHTHTTVVTTLAPIRATSAPIPAASVRAVTVRTPNTNFGNGLADTVYRYLLPVDAPIGRGIVLEMPSGLGAIDLWSGTEWVNQGASGGIVVVPPTMRTGGVVMARIVNNGQFFPGDTVPTLRGATAEDLA